MSNQLLHNDSLPGSRIGTEIIDAIKKAHSVDIAVSYLQMSGWFKLRPQLERFSPAKVRIVTTDQMNITQPSVLNAALDSGFRIKCYRGSRNFHPKVYILHGAGKKQNVAILGSANISASGLENGIEAGVRTSDPVIFESLAHWFNDLFDDSAARSVDRRFVREYEKRWKPAAKARVQIRRLAAPRVKASPTPTIEDAETLDDAFSTISLPVGTLGFDHAGNNIRNFARLFEVLARFPRLSSKEESELRLLGLLRGEKLTSVGKKAKRCRTPQDIAKVWCAWVKTTPVSELGNINALLVSFKRAVQRFWSLDPEVQAYFLRELSDSDQRKTLQTIELCCNGSQVVEALSVSDFKYMSRFLLTGADLSEFIKHAVANYIENKGGRSWRSDDRRTVLNAWRSAP